MVKLPAHQKSLVVVYHEHAIECRPQNIYLNFCSESQLFDKKNTLQACDFIDQVRPKALETYLQCVANIGTARDENNHAFRELLKNGDGFSRWWFHSVSAKDSENDPTLDYIIHLLVISEVYQQHQCDSIVLIGAPWKVYQTLQTKYPVENVDGRQTSLIKDIFISFLKRIKFALTFFVEWCVLKVLVKNKKSNLDIVLSGFYPWSVDIEPVSREIKDQYYKDVGKKLKDSGRQVDWLLWFDHGFKKRKNSENIFQLIKKVNSVNEILLVQSFVCLGEIVKAFFNFKPFFLNESFKRRKIIEKHLVFQDMNFYPLFARDLTTGFLDCQLLRFQLIFFGYKNATQSLKPNVHLGFMNFFRFARACYAGVKKGFDQCFIYDMQHASYTFEKTIGSLDAAIEFQGFKDGCGLIAADTMFVMGELGMEVFHRSGYPKQRLQLTGSARYEREYHQPIIEKTRHKLIKNILIVTTLRKDHDIAMIEAVYQALKDDDQIKVRLRLHPFSQLTSSTLFDRYLDRIDISTAENLQDDLDQTDVVVFSYSTVAEQAFIQGIPVWQWYALGANFSVFGVLNCIPKFHHADQLKGLLESFLKNPQPFFPTIQQRQDVRQKCFYHDGLSPCENIVATILKNERKP